MTSPQAAGAPAVSVVIVFWNAERFIGEAIESVLAQSFDDWELLLVDDGSEDGSTDIARRYAVGGDRRIRSLSHPGNAHRGISAARNLGLDHARGRYLAYLDADDVWLPATLSDQVAILEAQPRAAMVFGPLYWWFSWTGRPEDRDADYIEDLGVPANRLIEPPRLLARFVQDKAAVPSGMLIRRGVAERVGGFEDDFRGEYDDQVFCAKICLEEPVFVAGRHWYRYRRHDDSTVAVGLRTGATDDARRQFLGWLERYMSERGVRSAEMWRALRLEQWRFTRPRSFQLLRRSERAAGRLATRLRVAR
jgi:glycosyltransferase involved in cell wall biosynthesis